LVAKAVSAGTPAAPRRAGSLDLFQKSFHRL
jgi:hypothetical protein